MNSDMSSAYYSAWYIETIIIVNTGSGRSKACLSVLGREITWV